MSDYDYLFKILLIGDSATGKSCLLLRYTDDCYSDKFLATIGVDFKIKAMELDGKMVKMMIWDTAGQDRFRTITTAYYRGAHGILVTYDCTDRESFNHVPSWIREARKFICDKTQLALVATKCDLVKKKVVTSEEGAALAAEYNMTFTETSSKDSLHVDRVFTRLAQDLKDADVGRKKFDVDRDEPQKLKPGVPIGGAKGLFSWCQIL